METAIQVVWWIGLLGAVILTLVILKEIALLLRVLRDIDQLAGFTQDAARGVARNVDVAPELAAAWDQASHLRDTVRELARAATLVESKLGRFAGGPARGNE